MAFLDYSVRSGNAALAKHLKEASNNAIYTSKTTQNQLIECIGDHIRHKIIQEIKQAKYYSVLCDEVVDVSTKEQVSRGLLIVIVICDRLCEKGAYGAITKFEI